MTEAISRPDNFFFNFDTCPVKKKPDKVYHGTRASPDVILKEGLKYPGESYLLEMIKRAMQVAGMSYDVWIAYETKRDKQGHLTHLNEIQRPRRKNVWVTDQLDVAWSYARRSPEIVTESVRNEYIRLHIRRKNLLTEVETIVDRCVNDIGDPIVVELDAKMIGAQGGINESTLPVIGREAITNIFDKTEMIPQRRW